MRRSLALLALAAGVGLCGITWGLPGKARWAALPPALHGDQAAARRLAEAWSKLYQAIERAHLERAREEPVTSIQGVREFRPGWVFPPDALVGSVRSTLLRTEDPDEQQTLAELARMRPGRGDFKPLYIHYGGSYLYFVGAVLWLAAKARLIELVPDASFYLLHPDAIARLYLAGRLIIAGFFLLSVWLVYDLGRRCSGERAGLFAGTFYSLCPAVVVQSHIFKPHVFAAFWILAAVRLALAAADTGRLRDFLLCGLCAGIGGGASFFMLAFGALPLAAALLRRGDSRVWSRALAGGAACAAVFAALNPYYLLAHADYFWETTIYPAGGGASSLFSVAWFFGRPLTRAMGAGLETLCALGIWQSFRRGGSREARFCAAVLLVATAVLALAVGLLWGFVSGPGAARFFFPLFGLACVLAGSWAAAGRARPWLRAVLVVAALAELSARSAVYLRNFAADAGPASTRAQAAGWISAHIPAGSSVGLARYPQPFGTPPFRYDLYRLIVFEDPSLLAPRGRPDWIVADAGDGQRLEQALPGAYTLAAAFEPRWTALAPLADDSFFANSAMYIFRRAKANPAALGAVQ